MSQDKFGARQCPKRRRGDMCSPYAVNPPPPWDTLQGGDICVHCGQPLPQRPIADEIAECGDQQPEIEFPQYDFVAAAVSLGMQDIVVHLDPQQKMVAFHSPLTDKYLRCEICEGGARVYLA